MLKRTMINKLSFRHLILILVLSGLSGVITQCSDIPDKQEIAAGDLLQTALSNERYLSTDVLAKKIIARDPSFILIDVRNAEEFQTYALPNAINIPLKNLLDEKYAPQLKQGQYDIVFYSNDNFHADQAWMLSMRQGYQSLKVLEGGLNKWYSTIIDPPVPDEKMGSDDLALYSTRKASSMYFGVAYPEPVQKKEEVIKPAPKKIVPVKKKKKRPVEGGC